MGFPYAEAADVAVLFRPLTEDEEALADALLAHASAMLRGRFPNLDARIADGYLDAEQARVAAVNMVLRVMRNPGGPGGPGGLKSETVGPFIRSWDTSSGAAGFLAVTDAELALLAGAAVVAGPGVGNVRLQAGMGWYSGGRGVCRW